MNNAKNTTLFPYLERLLDGEKVEWKTLGEVCDYIRGITYNKSAETTEVDGWKVLRANNITLETRKLNFNEVKHVKKTIRVRENQMLHKGDILICAGSGSKEHIGKTAYIESDIDYTFGGFMGVLRLKEEKTISSRYLFHYIGSGAFTTYLGATLKSSTINNLNNGIISPFTIPIPSLRVQARIVEILDKFTQLEAELEAELEARRKQYAYYRDQLLNFSQYPPLNVNIEWKTLGEVCHIVGRIGFRGYTRNDLVERGEGAISISPTNIVNQNLNLSAEKNTYISWEKYNESPEIMIRIGDIVLAKTASVGKAALVRELKEKATINPQMVVLKEISCLPAYLVYYICTPNFQLRLKSLSGQGSVPNISQAKLKTIPIPLPPLSEQRRIVDILDRFDTLTNSISEGLPKEIALRRKQYAYYRDALLSFPRPEASA